MSDLPLNWTCSGDVLSGDSSGNLIVWGRGTNTIQKLVRGVHAGPVFSVACLKDGSIVSGGGKDGRVVMFDAECNAMGRDSVVSSICQLNYSWTYAVVYVRRNVW